MNHEISLQRDHVRRFIFEPHPVRGHAVHLTDAWRELRAHGAYPDAVMILLGEALVASVLLAATLKFRGTLTLQLQGNGAVGLLVAQCTHDFRVRAVARHEAEQVAAAVQAQSPAARFRALTGSEGRVTVTVEAEERSLRYQGIVPLSGASLSQSLEAYFASSEQLPTHVLLAADGEHAAGMLVQKLPEKGEAADEALAAAWDGAARGLTGLAGATLLGGNLEGLLGQAFPGHDLRLFRGAPVRFECRCSVARVAGLLRALGADDVRDVLREQGAVTVTCEFCQRPYRFDALAVEALFAPDPAAGSSAILH
jgi:molecular chaperone Hsp33